MGVAGKTNRANRDDRDVRKQILSKFYEVYQEHGLYVIVELGQVAGDLKLDSAQAKRCFDYLAEKGFIRPMTLGGGYSPTVDLIDAVEEERGAST